jgi:organic radical activating enzyme
MVPKSYSEEPKESLMITSLFKTMQGEGPFAGRSCVFLRLTGCNLKCSFCDTFFDSGDTLSFQEIIVRIHEAELRFYRSRNIDIRSTALETQKRLLVITGGEPTAQPNLTGFIDQIIGLGWDVQIESNGLIKRHLHPDAYYVVSPKVNEKTKQFIKLNTDMLMRANCLKFVISKTEPGYTDIPEFALEWRKEADERGVEKRIYVSPMNMYATQPVKLGANGTLEGRSEVDERISFWTPGLLDMKKNQENHEWAAEIALKHRAYLTLQTHLMASLP